MRKYNTDREVLNFLYNSDNIENCDTCPYDMNCKGVNQLPCGQYHCWVALHCKQAEEV